MLSPSAHQLLQMFFDFWGSMKADRERGDIGESIILRVREQWVPWWMGQTSSRQAEIIHLLDSVRPGSAESLFILQQLRIHIESDVDVDGVLYGPASGDWVFMQLAHIGPFAETGLFDAWRLDRVRGFRAPCLGPVNRTFPILAKLLRVKSRPHYAYNVEFRDPGGVSNAITAARHLLGRWRNCIWFHRSPIGWSHRPWALRIPAMAALLSGTLCMAYILAAWWLGALTEETLFGALYGTYLSALLLSLLWMAATINDFCINWRLAKALKTSTVAWALGDVLPRQEGRGPLEVEGESFGAALGMSVIHAVAVTQTEDSWISWCIRKAADNMDRLALTGELAPSTHIGPVGGFDPKTKDNKITICAKEKRDLLAPVQRETLADPSVVTCPTLGSMIWAAGTRFGNGKNRFLPLGLKLWSSAAVSLFLLLIGIHARTLISPPDLGIDASTAPILEDRDRTHQTLMLRLNTSCTGCFAVVNSQFWKTQTKRSLLSKAEGSDVAVANIALEPSGTIGNGMESSVQVLRPRHFLGLELAPQSLLEVTFFRLEDMHKRLAREGRYASPGH